MSAAATMNIPGDSPSASGAHFGVDLKHFRLARRLSEDEAGLLLGISGNYVYMIERGKLEAAPRVRERFRAVAEASNLYAVEVPWPGGLRERDIGVISWAQAGKAVCFEEMPPEWLESIRSACPDQQAFGIRLVGDSMEPHHRAGEVVVVMPNHVPRHGCLVVTRLITEGVMFKRFMVSKGRPHQFRLCSYNPKYPPVELTWNDVQWVYPVFCAKGLAAAGGRR